MSAASDCVVGNPFINTEADKATTVSTSQTLANLIKLANPKLERLRKLVKEKSGKHCFRNATEKHNNIKRNALCVNSNHNRRGSKFNNDNIF